MSIIDEALARTNARTARTIDYDRLNRHMPAMKAALTRATKPTPWPPCETRVADGVFPHGDPEVVARVCKQAVEFWDTCGAWPDNWHRWQVALDDALGWPLHIELGDL